MTDLRQAAQAVVDRWDSPLWKNGSTADAIADLRTALGQQQAEPVYRKGCAECGKAKQVQEDDDEWKADLAKGRKILAQQSDPVSSVAFQHRQEQIEKKMAGVYSAFSTTHSALEQQAEPVAYDKTAMNSFVIDLYDRKMQEGKHGHYETMFHVVHQAIKRFAPPQQQAEPVAWGMAEKDGLILDVICPEEHQSCKGEYTIPLYTTPPQRQWVGLTDAEIEDAIDDGFSSTLDNGNVSTNAVIKYVRIIEAKLKEKNT